MLKILSPSTTVWSDLTGVPPSLFEETVPSYLEITYILLNFPKLHEIIDIIASRIGFIVFPFGFTMLRYVAFRFCCVSFWVHCVASVLSFVRSFHSVSFRFGFVWYCIVFLYLDNAILEFSLTEPSGHNSNNAMQ